MSTNVEGQSVSPNDAKPLLAEVPLELQKYLERVYNKVAPIEKGVKKISEYGGSIFVHFNSGRTYRLNFQLYNKEVCLDGAF